MLAIEKENSDAMNNLAYYYENQNDYVNMMKYYLMSIEKDNSGTMNNLACYYYRKKNYENTIKYNLMLAKKDPVMANNNFKKIDNKIIINYLLKLNNDKKSNIIKIKLKQIKNKLKFKPNGCEYYNTEKHFNSLITT